MSSIEDFDTTRLLGAVDALDKMRNTLNGGQGSPPPKLRDDLLQLHHLAMQVCNDGSDRKADEMFERASQLQASVEDMISALEHVQDTLAELVAAQADDELDDDD